MPDVFSVEDHLAWILDRIRPLDPDPHPLAEANGLVSSRDVLAPISLPRFDNSGMDGYAVHFRDVADATAERPVHLPVVGEIAAGTASIYTLDAGTAVRIMTGGAVPVGADAIVPVEWTNDSDTEVLINQAPKPGQHIRPLGEDVTKGDVLVEAGELIGPRQIGLLAGAGVANVLAPQRPRVVIMSTGTELVEPGGKLQRDSIYESNSYMLAAAVRDLGAIAYRVGASSDDPEVFAEALNDQLVRADMVITSGGVSMGTHDVVKAALRPQGEVEFRQVAMQPGKPQGFGLIGPDRTPIFTLPGNPVSSFVSFEVFVLPALRMMMGRTPTSRPLHRATLTESVQSIRGRKQFLRARVVTDRTGTHVTPVGGPGSHLMAGLAHANALIVLGENVEGAEAGKPVPVLLLERPF